MSRLGRGGSQRQKGQSGEELHREGQLFPIFSSRDECTVAATVAAFEFLYLREIGFARQAKGSGKDPKTYSTPAAGYEIMIPEIASGIGDHSIEQNAPRGARKAR